MNVSDSLSKNTIIKKEQFQQPKINIHEDIRKKLHSFYISNRIPNIIFYGSSGSGKQTVVHDFLKEIYQGSDTKMKANVMFVNCAHGKGIKFIREELKFFAKTNVQFNSGIWFKTIVLLNADHLTMDAQSALRRCIELFSHNTRFFIIVENKHKLLNPILSRFCEIYVPEHIDNGKIVNLHQWQIQQTFSFQEQIQKNQMDILDKHLREYFTEPKQVFTHNKMAELSLFFYENALSSIDIISWIKQSAYWPEIEIANICMCYSKIKSEIRSEKLLILFLLDFIYNRPNADLKEISFI
jgi:replication-associated recombination protein RarA